MSDKAKKTVGVFIGRFQPFHIGHDFVIREALRKVDNLVILIGSANRARSQVNPFTYEEREDFIRREYRKDVSENKLLIAPLHDHAQDSKWCAEAEKSAARTMVEIGLSIDDVEFNLVGYAKDGSSYYLRKFPHWGSIEIESQFGTFSATDIRNDFLRRAPIIPHDNCPISVIEFMKKFRLREEFKWLLSEREFEIEYKRPYTGLEHPPNFITTDAVIEQNGMILVVRRGQCPGKGLLALPGGHLEPNLTLWDNVLKEVQEETGLDPDVIKEACLGQGQVFDDPTRSTRGRTVTNVYRFRLPDGLQTRVTAGDDAADAFWINPKTADPREFMEDHYLILQSLGLTG
ncbi:NUDIX domain-containing protein [Roseibium sp. RKSG952]|uniref:NUDIX domain-containing protein n=1 Tax=Roseibium sp. RKSG952 TaxID=2529384 RepID=UPI0012BD7F06|nr:NUDIX domain-containing protein [Roseibium sp. RKSG952]MTH95009.1 NUDIX domain-containing protein [Roseibium sp. RKSG952]